MKRLRAMNASPQWPCNIVLRQSATGSRRERKLILQCWKQDSKQRWQEVQTLCQVESQEVTSEKSVQLWRSQQDCHSQWRSVSKDRRFGTVQSKNWPSKGGIGFLEGAGTLASESQDATDGRQMGSKIQSLRQSKTRKKPYRMSKKSCKVLSNISWTFKNRHRTSRTKSCGWKTQKEDKEQVTWVACNKVARTDERVV